MRAHSLLLLTAVASLAAAGPDWPHYGGGPEQTRYSPLTQITPANVGSLKVAWTYDTRRRLQGLRDAVPARGGARRPLRDVAQAARVRARRRDRRASWSFDPSQDAKTLPSRTRIRGLMYWERGDERRIYFGARHWLYALDATTGKPIAAVRPGRPHRPARGLRGTRPAHAQRRRQHAGRLLRRSADPRLGRARRGCPSAPGDIRAFDVNTGRQKWAFHTIPHPGEFGYDTWPKDAWKYSGGANAWSGVSLDEERGLVFAATGSASYDFYGANRHGDNLFANTILCLRAATGERVWHFQARQARRLGPRFPRAPDARHGHEGRPAARRRRADREERAHSTSSTARRASRSFRWSECTPPASDVRRRAARRRRRCCRRCRRRSRASGSPRT